MNVTRRELLGWTAGTAAGALVSLDRSRASTAAFLGLRPPKARRPSVSEIEETVHWVLVTPRDAALQRGARELAKGLPPTELLGAVLVAAARKIKPFHHSPAVVASIDEIARTAPESERAADVLWCLDSFKEAQEARSGPNEWTWKPVDAQRVPRAESARAALVDALERWDAEAADAALVGFVRTAPLDEVFELLWEYATRCRANIGHKAILAAQIRRALPLAGVECAEEMLRSLVMTYLAGGPTDNAAAFEKSREILMRGRIVGKSWDVADLGGARELAIELRRADHDALPAIVAKLLQDGASSTTLWDAVVTVASEFTVGRPGIGPLHAVTSTNALHHIALHAGSERLALLALMQAAAWVRLFDRAEPAASKFRVEGLAPLDAPDGDVLTGTPAEIARRAVTAGRNAADAERFRAQAAALVRRKADDVHEFKLAVAALEESRRVGSWARPAVLASLAVHLPDPNRPESEQRARIREALARAQ